MSKDNALQRLVDKCGLNWKLDRRKRDVSGIKVGTQYGKWTTLDTPYTCDRKLMVKCRCECGFETEVKLNNLESGKSKQCVECGKNALRTHSPGDQFNWWTFQSYSKEDPRKGWFKCRCGNYAHLITGNVSTGKPKKCKKCRTLHGDKPDGNAYWVSIVSGAKARGFEVAMTWDDAKHLLEKQEWKCAMTGLPIHLPMSTSQIKVNLKTASLDRIDSSKGYTIDNVQWVHKHVNRMKLDFDVNQFLNYCVLIADKYRGESGDIPEDIDFDMTPKDRRMKRQDEIDLEAAVRDGETPRDAGKRLGMPAKRVDYLCRKWTNLGWYEYSTACDLGWAKVTPDAP